MRKETKKTSPFPTLFSPLIVYRYCVKIILMKKKIDKFKDPYPLSIKFANTVFIFGILYSILFIIFSIYKILYPPDSGFACLGCPSSMATQKGFYYVCILLGSIFAILFIFGLTINNKLKINLSLLCITVGISFYIFEDSLQPLFL